MQGACQASDGGCPKAAQLMYGVDVTRSSQSKEVLTFKTASQGFPGGAVVENLPANAGDTGSSPGLGRSHMPWSN